MIKKKNNNSDIYIDFNIQKYTNKNSIYIGG